MRSLVTLSLLASFWWPVATQAQVMPSSSSASASASASATTQVISTGLSQDGLITHDDQGHKIWVDHDNDDQRRIVRHDSDDHDTVVAASNQLPPSPITAMGYFQGNLYILCDSTLYMIDGSHDLRPIANNLPFPNQAQTNRIVFNNNQIFIINIAVQNSSMRPWYRQWWSQPTSTSCQQFDLTGYWDQNNGWNRFQPMRYQTDAPLNIPVSNDYWVDGSPQCQSQVMNVGYAPNYSNYSPAPTAYGPTNCPYLDRLWDQENNTYSC